MHRAAQFLPHLEGIRVDPNDPASVRVGLRPFAHGGLPMVGPVPGVQGVWVKTGTSDVQSVCAVSNSRGPCLSTVAVDGLVALHFTSTGTLFS